MQDDQCDTNDHAHGQNHPDDAGKPGALKGARRVWREAFKKGLQREYLVGCLPYFFSSLKTECVHRQDYQNRVEAKQSLFEWIEVFYNRQRRHSSLGYVSPPVYEQQTCLC